jgi:hypothetical protein
VSAFLIGILSLCFFLFTSADLLAEKQYSLISKSGVKEKEQRDSIGVSCDETLKNAISLNESFKNAVSAGGRHALGQESGKYFHGILLRELPLCVSYAAERTDAALSRQIFELTYSYANSTDKVIPLELARFFSINQEMTKTILLEYEKSRRHEFMEILKIGLEELYRKPEDASRLKELTRFLNEVELQ